MSSRRKPASRQDAKLQEFSSRYRDNPTEALAARIIGLLEKTRRYGDAFKWARHGRAKYPRSRRISRQYRKLKDARTQASLREAKARAKADPTAANLSRLSELLRLSGKWKKAWKLATKTDRKFPENWRVQLALGKLHFERYSRTRKPDHGWSAVDFLDNSRCLNPTNVSTLILLAITLMRLRSYEDASLVVDEALQIDPSNKRAGNIRQQLDRAFPQRDTALSAPSAARPAATDLLKRVMAIPGSIGAYQFSENGRVLDSSVRDNQSFDFDVPVEVFEGMANACRFDTHRIGLGDFISCTLSGEGWCMDYHTSDNGAVLTFFEGELTAEQVQNRIREATGNGSGAASEARDLSHTAN